MIMIEHYISLLEVVFILRSNKEEVVLELSSCYRKILPPGCLFFFQIIYCPLWWVYQQNHLQKLLLQLWPFMNQMNQVGCKLYALEYLSIDVAVR